jgi:hypothetical protein
LIEHTDEFLTLEGLRIIWERNRASDTAQSSGAKLPKTPVDSRKTRR